MNSSSDHQIKSNIKCPKCSQVMIYDGIDTVRCRYCGYSKGQLDHLHVISNNNQTLFVGGRLSIDKELLCLLDIDVIITVAEDFQDVIPLSIKYYYRINLSDSNKCKKEDFIIAVQTLSYVMLHNASSNILIH